MQGCEAMDARRRFSAGVKTTPRCAWCGVDESDHWQGQGPVLYCSMECAEAAASGWTTPDEDHAMIPLVREPIERDALENALPRMATKETMLDSLRVTPEVLLARLRHIFSKMNLYTVIRETRTEGALFAGHIVGWAKSGNSGRHIAVDMNVTGLSGVPKSRSRLLVCGEDGTEPMLITEELIARITGKTLSPRHVQAEPRASPQPVDIHYPGQKVVLIGKADVSDDEIGVSVSITNESLHPITGLNIVVISYPSKSLRLMTNNENRLPVLEGGKTEMMRFRLKPISDCIKGEIVAAASYSDANGVTHTIGAEPIPLRAVCVFNVPESVDAASLERELAGLEYGEMAINLENLTSREMYERTIAVLRELKFYRVSASLKETDGLVMGEINGWSRGLRSRRRLGISVIVFGPEQGIGCSCRIVISAEDDTIILTAIEETRHALDI